MNYTGTSILPVKVTYDEIFGLTVCVHYHHKTEETRNPYFSVLEL